MRATAILQAITAKPWLPQPAPAPLPPRTPAASVALRVLFGVIGAFFGLLVLAFLIRAQLPDWRALGGETAPLGRSLPLWINTALLLASSVALQMASRAARHARARPIRRALLLGGALAAAFVLGQLLVWRELVALGYYVASNPAASFFYLLTGLHGLHIVGGLVAWGRVTARAWGDPRDERLRLGAALVSRYWHFLVAVWLVLFALLASPPQALETLAEICGIR